MNETNAKTIFNLLQFLKLLRLESVRVDIRIPVILYTDIINRLLHLFSIYKQNESFVYIFYEDDLYFIKETTLYKEEIAYDIVKEKLTIDLDKFYNVIFNICGHSVYEDIKHDLQQIK